MYQVITRNMEELRSRQLLYGASITVTKENIQEVTSPDYIRNVRQTSLRQALNSQLFKNIRSEGLLLDNHEGGCVLYEKRDQVQALLGNSGNVVLPS